MPTSPQTSAQQYLIRARAEAHWNRSRARVKSGPTLPVNKCTSEDQAARAWEEVLRHEPPWTDADLNGDFPADLWYCGSWKNEAQEFFKLLQRGHNVETLRGDIGISVAEVDDLNRWIAWKPSLESRIRRMIVHREKVLAAFNTLVENDARSQPSAAD